MRPALPVLAVSGVAVAAVLSGCGTQPAASVQPVAQSQDLPSVVAPPTASTPPAVTPAAATRTTSSPSATPTTQPARGPLFDSPEAAMRFMAAAFDRRDATALRAVTTPESRRELFDMWPKQVHLRLSSCQRESDGTYTCLFPHDPPPGMKVPPGGVVATMTVAPAARPGWYLSGIITCG